jgi:hypothetical protein
VFTGSGSFDAIANKAPIVGKSVLRDLVEMDGCVVIVIAPFYLIAT